MNIIPLNIIGYKKILKINMALDKLYARNKYKNPNSIDVLIKNNFVKLLRTLFISLLLNDFSTPIRIISEENTANVIEIML